MTSLRLLKEKEWDLLYSRIQQVLQSRGYTMSDLDCNIAAERILATERDTKVNYYLTNDTALILRLKQELDLSAFVDYTPLFGKKDKDDTSDEEDDEDIDDLFPVVASYNITPSLLAGKTINVTPVGLLGYVCTMEGINGGFYVNQTFLAPYANGNTTYEAIQRFQFITDRLLLGDSMVFNSNCAVTTVYTSLEDVAEATSILLTEADNRQQELPDFSWEGFYFGCIRCKVRRAEDVAQAFRAEEPLTQELCTNLERVSREFNQLMGTSFTSQELVTLAASIDTGTRNKRLRIAFNI